jgi:glycosyltransferase involved in cell wall biosynthesis
MSRPTVDIVIPVQAETSLLDGCVAALDRHTDDYRLHIIKAPGLNVSEARQAAMDSLTGARYICYLDDDSRVTQGWLDPMVAAVDGNTRCAVAFAEEDWGEHGVLQRYHGVQPCEYGPAACMLVDTSKIPDDVRWNTSIGLRTGWLGGDFEEVEYAHQLKYHGLHLVGVSGSRFVHIDRPSLEEFRKTDRAKTCMIMQALIRHWSRACPENREFFRRMEYVPASKHNDRMLAPGATLKQAFGGIVRDNHMQHFPMFQRWGIA